MLTRCQQWRACFCVVLTCPTCPALSQSCLQGICVRSEHVTCQLHSAPMPALGEDPCRVFMAADHLHDAASKAQVALPPRPACRDNHHPNMWVHVLLVYAGKPAAQTPRGAISHAAWSQPCSLLKPTPIDLRVMWQTGLRACCAATKQLQP